MPNSHSNAARRSDTIPEAQAEAHSLLSSFAADEDEDQPPEIAIRRPSPLQRQSSIYRDPANGQPKPPRTTNRVHFDVEDSGLVDESPLRHREAGLNEPGDWSEEEEELDEEQAFRGRDQIDQQAPLLTNIEAPSVTVAADLIDDTDDLLESARPKSGMRSAFMNMANSIM